MQMAELPSVETTRQFLMNYCRRIERNGIFVRRRRHGTITRCMIHARVEREQAFLTDTTEAVEYADRLRIVFALTRDPNIVEGWTKWCFQDEWRALMHWCEQQEANNLSVQGHIDIHNPTLPPTISESECLQTCTQGIFRLEADSVRFFVHAMECNGIMH